MHDLSKVSRRRFFDSRYAARYLVGKGLDIWPCGEKLDDFRQLFPLITTCRTWELADGDPQYLTGLANESFDFVHSVHCLQQLQQPDVAIGNWNRVLQPGGHLIVLVPDEDMYEQGVFPSSFNPDNRWTFTIDKSASWSPNSISLMRLLSAMSGLAQTLRLELIDVGYRFGSPRSDQTITMVAESAIEFVMRKWHPGELVRKGR
jgi:SAM-dependent methyltransferase